MRGRRDEVCSALESIAGVSDLLVLDHVPVETLLVAEQSSSDHYRSRNSENNKEVSIRTTKRACALYLRFVH